MRRSQSGFTLVEVAVTVGLIALMAGMAGTAVVPAIERYRVQQASSLLSDALRRAQSKAVSEHQTWRVVVDADGRGISQEYTNSPSPATDCSSTWIQAKHDELPKGVSVQTKSRQCITFATTGRTLDPMPQVDVNLTTLPFNGGPSRLRLTDGYQVPDQLVFNPYDSAAPTAAWTDDSVSITLDGMESRYYEMICIAMMSDPDVSVGYPASIQVEGAPASGTWTTFYSQPGPADPGSRAHTCVPITINQALRYFRVTLARSAMDIAVDEVNLGDFFFTMSGNGGSKQVLVSPLTGKVSIKSN